LAKPPDCGQESLTDGAGSTIGTPAISLSGSSSLLSENTGTRSPTSGVLLLPNQSLTVSQPDSDTMSRKPTRPMRDEAAARNTFCIAVTSPLPVRGN
jgi:hypothetical protein